MTILPNGLLVSGSSDRTIRIWNTNTGTKVKTLIDCYFSITCMKSLPDHRLICGTQNGSLIIWKLDFLGEDNHDIVHGTAYKESTLKIHDNKPVMGIELLHNRYVLSVSRDSLKILY